jgi:hypothetical protein
MASMKGRKSDVSAVENPPDVENHAQKPPTKRSLPGEANKNTGQEKQRDNVQGGGGGNLGGGGKKKTAVRES